MPDDRMTLQPGDRVVLVIEGEVDVARLILDAARERELRGLVALGGDAGLALAHELRPDAILLDLDLPDADGIRVLDHLKQHPETRHIPVYTFSQEGQRHAALRAGAAAHTSEPVNAALARMFDELMGFLERRVKKLLVVEDDEAERLSIVELIGGEEDVEVTAVGSSEDALEALEHDRFDCLVLDLKLPQMTGFVLLEHIKKDESLHDIPVIVHTGKQLTQKEETRLRRYAESIIVKDVGSPERLLDETTLFMHRPRSCLPANKRKMLDQLYSADAVFKDKKVLIVDDDVRNAFALASAFELRGIEVLFAENGKEAIGILEQDPAVDLVLMDVMMPEMDGHETTRAIRAMPPFRQLPIVTLTAKAMKEDREKSVASGASDYVTKPVDIEQLLSLMRVWMHG
jgi:CheY-like chemotaxis protein